MASCETVHVEANTMLNVERFCSAQCGRPRDLPYSRYCRTCRNAYARAHRPTHGELSPGERLKANCRAYTNTLIRRGDLVPQPCEDCGAAQDIQPHHEDYTDPRNVRWKCRSCHHKHHHPERPPTCATCGGTNDRVHQGQAYYRACHNAHMRRHRAEQRARRRALLSELAHLRSLTSSSKGPSA